MEFSIASYLQGIFSKLDQLRTFHVFFYINWKEPSRNFETLLAKKDRKEKKI